MDDDGMERTGSGQNGPPYYDRLRYFVERGALRSCPGTTVASEETTILAAHPSGIVTVRPVTGTEHTTGLGRR